MWGSSTIATRTWLRGRGVFMTRMSGPIARCRRSACRESTGWPPDGRRVSCGARVSVGLVRPAQAGTATAINVASAPVLILQNAGAKATSLRRVDGRGCVGPPRPRSAPIVQPLTRLLEIEHPRESGSAVSDFEPRDLFKPADLLLDHVGGGQGRRQAFATV